MGLLADHQIRARCVPPKLYAFPVHDQTKEQLYVPYGKDAAIKTVEQLDAWIGDGKRRFNPQLRHVLNQQDCDEYVKRSGWKPMISPFVDGLIRKVDDQRIISYGLSSYGYDIRIAAKDIKLFNNLAGLVVDPMRIQEGRYVTPVIEHDEEFGLDYFILPPNSLVLAHTVESFCIPRDILVTCIGKSTYARVGVHQLVTPLEPEWEGELVLEIASATNYHTRVYIGCGIAQLMFNECSQLCEVSYKDRGGKYQSQKGTVDALI